jgi:hypothetical protein
MLMKMLAERIVGISSDALRDLPGIPCHALHGVIVWLRYVACGGIPAHRNSTDSSTVRT